MNKYFKNLILCGDIDYHCLLCKETFHAVEDLEKHIRWEKHRKSLKLLSCMPKFKKDSIYKIDDHYYCEFCNNVMATIAEISLHIQEAKHKENKANPITEAKGTICKRESSLIVVGTMKITNKEWNGVVDNKCMFCDIVVDKFVKHISTTTHMINLIKSEVFMKDNDQYYRKINHEQSYCFSCKKIFASQSMNDHWSDDYHIEKSTVKKDETDKKSEISDHERALDIAVKLINSQKEYFDIDIENKVAMCKICTAYVNINFKFMVEHKKTHNITNNERVEQADADITELIESLKAKSSTGNVDEDHTLCIFDHGKRRAELAKYGKTTFIKLVPPGGKGYCSLCNVYMSAHMKLFTEHARGQIHMGHLELKGLDKSARPHAKPSYRTKQMKNYLRSVIHAKDLKMVWIQKRYCMDPLCFMLIAIINEKADKNIVKCYACDVTYDQRKEPEHCYTKKHKQVFLDSEVVTTIQGDFVREIHPNLFHCGICNLTFPFCETIEKHLQSWKHVFAKNDKQVMFKLTEQWYGNAVSPSLNPDKVYPYLISENDKSSWSLVLVKYKTPTCEVVFKCMEL